MRLDALKLLHHPHNDIERLSDGVILTNTGPRSTVERDVILEENMSNQHCVCGIGKTESGIETYP